MAVYNDIFTPDNIIFMLKGAGLSLALAFGAVIIGMVIGVLVSALKLSKFKIFRIIGNIYVELIRGTPMLLQILFFYLSVPQIISMISGSAFKANPFVVGLIALSLNSGAYQTELIRSGIQGIDTGQWEAAKTLGLNYVQTMRFIILPQTFKRIIPPLCSEFITLIKDSSLVSTIGVIELLYASKVLGARYYDYIGPLVAASIMYLILTLVVSFIVRVIERKFAISD